MTVEPQAPAPAVELRVNGSVLAKSSASDLHDFDPVLRGVALSDSPVLLEGPADHQSLLVNRIHLLGRRAELPLHICYSARDAEVLFEALQESGSVTQNSLGTWALHEVSSWPDELQRTLSGILDLLDEGRLHGRLRHEVIPRVVVLEEELPDVASTYTPELQKRLSFFHLSTCPKKRTKKERRR